MSVRIEMSIKVLVAIKKAKDVNKLLKIQMKKEQQKVRTKEQCHLCVKQLQCQKTQQWKCVLIRKNQAT